MAYTTVGANPNPIRTPVGKKGATTPRISPIKAALPLVPGTLRIQPSPEAAAGEEGEDNTKTHYGTIAVFAALVAGIWYWQRKSR